MSTDAPGARPLGQGRLTLKDVVAQAIGFNGPVFGVAALIPLLVGASATGKGAGVATPLAIVIAAVGMTAVYWIISRYARRIHACGSLYEYVTDAFGQRAGFLAGWTYYGAMTALWMATVLVFGGFASGFLLSAFSIDVPWWVLSILFVALVGTLLVLGVQLATRAQLALVLVSALTVLAFSLSIILQGGARGLSLAPFDPSEAGAGGIFYGLIYAILLFIGIETAANLAEETRHPKRDIPRAVMLALGLVSVYFVVCAYAQAVGFGLDGAAWAQSGFPLFVLGGGQFGSKLLADVLQLVVTLDVAAVGIGVATGASRGIFAMARGRRLPPALATVHPRHLTPVAAVALLLALGTVTWIVVAAADGLLSRATPDPSVLQPEWAPMFGWLAGLGGLGITLIYLVVSVAAIRGLWDIEQRPPLVLAGVVGAAVSLGAVWGAIYQAPSPANAIPWLLLGWIALGVAWAAVVGARGGFRTAVAS
jgi:amino acid transporter